MMFFSTAPIAATVINIAVAHSYVEISVEYIIITLRLPSGNLKTPDFFGVIPVGAEAEGRINTFTGGYEFDVKVNLKIAKFEGCLYRAGNLGGRRG